MVKETIQIFARIKPTKKNVAVYSVDNENQTGSSLEFFVPKDLADGFVNNKRECYNFRFQKVFDQVAKQEEIFENIAKPVADSVLAGYNGTIFAYGQTGSGKTFTITGGAEQYSDRGIIPRTLSYLYERFSQDSSMVYTTHISYLEIYNEMGYDLLDSRHEASRLEDLPKVMIMEDQDQNIHLRNLSLQQSVNEEEALNLLFLGDTNRMIAETPMNQASTRSHCIFTVHLCRREPGSATLRRSKLHLVDLAGSDRVSKTGLNGQLLTDAKYINLSLHYLEQVIIALSEKNRSHIPYRNSMLTSVLRDSLGGNCMTTMIATMAVERRNLEESISTCRFAQRVAVIKNEAILNEELDPALLIASLKREILSLKEELAMVTGEQRDDRLTPEEIQKLEELVKAYLDDPDPDVTLSLGPDMRKIQHCFSLLKGGKNRSSDDKATPAATGREEEIQHSHQSAGEVAKLKEMLGQRDNEISILWLAAAMLIFILSLSGPKLSMGKQEAFEIFIRDHEDHLTIEDNKSLLKQRSAEARKLGEELNEARNRIIPLISPVSYKSIVGRLKALRTEIEHLQLLLERSKVKLQKDFHKWWSQEASSLQVADVTLAASVQHHAQSVLGGRYVGGKYTQRHFHGTLCDPNKSLESSLEEQQQMMDSPISSSIPLTGDQQTDADILAFIRARQNLSIGCLSSNP
uniref:Kinesin family member 6 n=1 Tax=Maylandia zebra TaxID=106582 RepID=A0A3P9BTZ9_9CICH